MLLGEIEWLLSDVVLSKGQNGKVMSNGFVIIEIKQIKTVYLDYYSGLMELRTETQNLL